MAFRFSFESLLRLRRSEQQQQEFLLQKANEQINGTVREMEAIEIEVRQITSDGKSSAAFTGAEIQFDDFRCHVLGIRRMQAEQRLQAAREQQTLAAAGFQRAWQRREALEILRDRERQFYLLTESRLEQRRQDDLFLQRRRKR